MLTLTKFGWECFCIHKVLDLSKYKGRSYCYSIDGNHLLGNFHMRLTLKRFEFEHRKKIIYGSCFSQTLMNVTTSKLSYLHYLLHCTRDTLLRTIKYIFWTGRTNGLKGEWLQPYTGVEKPPLNRGGQCWDTILSSLPRRLYTFALVVTMPMMVVHTWPQETSDHNDIHYKSQEH